MAAFDELLMAVDRLGGQSLQLDEFFAATEECVPHEFSCRELVDGLVKPDAPDKGKYVKALAACLQDESRVRSGSDEDDDAAMDTISMFVAAAIAPVARPGEIHDQLDADSESVYAKSRPLAPYGLSVLEVLTEHGEAKLSDDVLLTVLAFTAPGESFRPEETIPGLAFDIVESQFGRQDIDLEVFVVDTILKGYLRPLFSKSKPASVTASGRRAEFPEEGDAHRGLDEETAQTKPWKYADLRAVPAFQWAVTVASDETISKQWPLFVPVLVTLLEEPTAWFRARGLTALDAFLKRLPFNILRNTGLNSVFEQAVLPTLLFLPTLTPEKESLQLLEPAYESLLTLAWKLSKEDKVKLLDKVLREGVFAGYFHSKEHVLIVEILVRKAGQVVRGMGLEAVKHLKDLMPIYSAIMTDPFALSYPPLLLAAVESLQSTIVTCWARIAQSPTQDETIKILVICWLNVQEDKTSNDSAAIADALVRTANILAEALKVAKIDPAEKVAPLIAKEPRLEGLFKDL